MTKQSLDQPTFPQLVAMWKRATYHARRRFMRKMVAPPLDFFLYKYKALNAETLLHVEDLLLNSRLYLSSPDQVNDPFDTSGFVHTDGTTAQWRARLKALIEKESNLNFRQRREELDRFMSEPREKWRQIVEDAHIKNVSKVGVCSFTIRPKSIVMWSHYAHQHTGLCFQFEIARDDTGTFITPVTIRYVDDYPVINWVLGTEGMEPMLRNKYKGWAYEEERRIFVPELGRQYLPFAPATLSGIIFGARTTAEHVEAVRQMIARRLAKGLPAVKLFKAKLHPSKYKLGVTRLI